MEYVRLGSTGIQVSRICLGCMGFGDAERWIHKWVLDEEHSRPVIQKALEFAEDVAYLEEPYVPHKVVGAL